MMHIRIVSTGPHLPDDSIQQPLSKCNFWQPQEINHENNIERCKHLDVHLLIFWQFYSSASLGLNRKRAREKL
jgi:hypothetical protein